MFHQCLRFLRPSRKKTQLRRDRHRVANSSGSHDATQDFATCQKRREGNGPMHRIVELNGREKKIESRSSVDTAQMWLASNSQS